jgi:putative tryptophan/tyrosine transport system substrate-binding protein
MDRRTFITVVGSNILAAPLVAWTQPAAGIARIGFLMASSPSAIPTRLEAFRRGLRERGYVEGKNIIIEWRSAEGKLDRIPTLAADLVRLNVDVIVTAGPMDTRAAKAATSTIPIVMTWDQDPVGNGFVTSIARPGGNITGLSSLAPEISGKQLEMLKEIVPKLSRVAFLGNSTEPGNAQALRETEASARSLGMQLQSYDVRASTDIETAIRSATSARAQAILVMTSPITFALRGRVVALAAEHRLPAIYQRRQFVEGGGLMSYGVSQDDLDRRAATYVDRILKGAKPADIPVEQPTKFELVINLKTAGALGLTLPPTLLVRADQVLE